MKRINVKSVFIILITFSLAFSATFIFFSVHNVKEEKVNINKKSAIATIINNMSQLNISEASSIPEGSVNQTRLLGAAKVFSDANAYVIGDSFAEGLTAYNVLNKSNVIWTRGRSVKYAIEDLNTLLNNGADVKYLFMQYGVNDVVNYGSNIDGFINAYKASVKTIKEKIPNAKIYANMLANATRSDVKDLIPEYNKKMTPMCEELSITCIDNNFILEEEENPIYNDGIHPKPFFFKEWAYNMINVAKLG